MTQDSTGSIILAPRLLATGDPPGDVLENINTNDLADGVLCYVSSGVGQGGWQLQKEATDAANGTTIVAPIAGPGRWFKKLLPGPGGGGGGGYPSQGAINTLNKADGAGGWLSTPFVIVGTQVQANQTIVLQAIGGTADIVGIAGRNIFFQASSGTGTITADEPLFLSSISADVSVTAGNDFVVNVTEAAEIVTSFGDINFRAAGNLISVAVNQNHQIDLTGEFAIEIEGTGDVPFLINQTTEDTKFPGRVLGWNGTENVYVERQIFSPYISNDALTNLPTFTNLTYRTAFLTAATPRQCVLPSLASTPDGSRYTVVDAAGTTDGIQVTVSGGALISGIPVFDMTSAYQSQTFEKFNTQWYLI